MRKRISRLIFGIVGLLAVSSANSVWACAVCFGQSDSPLAKGLHWGVISLLAVVGCVLTGIASFFVYLAKRSAMVSEDEFAEPKAESTPQV